MSAIKSYRAGSENKETTTETETMSMLAAGSQSVGPRWPADLLVYLHKI